MRGSTVLVVSDSLIDAKSISSILKAEGCGAARSAPFAEVERFAQDPTLSAILYVTEAEDKLGDLDTKTRWVLHRLRHAETNLPLVVLAGSSDRSVRMVCQNGRRAAILHAPLTELWREVRRLVLDMAVTQGTTELANSGTCGQRTSIPA